MIYKPLHLLQTMVQ